jgi:hypothetical protein
MTHTPGPWAISPDLKTIFNIDAQGYRASTVARVMIPSDTDAKQARANMRLIAAAPELLEALQSCVGSLLYAVDDLEAPENSMMRDNLAFALQTIKKAKGE